MYIRLITGLTACGMVAGKGLFQALQVESPCEAMDGSEVRLCGDSVDTSHIM